MNDIWRVSGDGRMMIFIVNIKRIMMKGMVAIRKLN